MSYIGIRSSKELIVSQYKLDHSYVFRIYENDEIRYAPGIVSRRNPTLLKREGDIVMFKTPGCTGWVGRGTSGYYHPQIIVGKVVKGDKIDTKVEIEYSRATTRKAKNIAWAVFDNMLRSKAFEITADGDFK